MPTETSRFKLISISDYIQWPLPTWIINEILPKAELGVIYGAPGSGKSFLALDMAFSIALGKEWQHHRTKQLNVVYMCMEAATDFVARLLAYCDEHDLHEKIHEIENLKIMPESVDIMAKTDIPDLINQLKPFNPHVIFIDTLARFMGGTNENSPDDMGLAIRQMQELHRSTGAMINLVHHSGKVAENGMRGHSSLHGATDVEIEVIKLTDGRRTARTAKQKGGQDDIKWGFSLKPIVVGTNADGDEISSCVYMPLDSVPIEELKPKQEGPVEIAIREIMNTYDGPYVPVEYIIDTIAKTLSFDPAKKDRRRERVTNSLKVLIDKKKLACTNNQVYWI